MIDENVLSAPQPEQKPSFRLATVRAVTESGATVQFEGEETASDKSYSVVQSYAPAVGDRVVLLNISGTYIILGSVGPPVAPASYIPLSQKGAANGVAALNANSQVIQKALTAAKADSATQASSATKADSATTAQTATTATTATNFSGKHTGSSLAFFGGSAAYKQTIFRLSSGVTLATVISRVNELMEDLDTYGLIDAT